MELPPHLTNPRKQVLVGVVPLGDVHRLRCGFHLKVVGDFLISLISVLLKTRDSYRLVPY